ncbi:MAG: DNA methyltransferase, partial [Dehalococcoidia bacterium]|nr:DNA methyltransferase [Dehalococcoidia bacterium]
MSDSLRAFNTYIRTIDKELALGNATEHTHRPALKALLESLGDGIVATNEPRRIECGAPDFIVSKGSTGIGYIEAKDVGKSLDEAEKSEQLQRYQDSLTNLILTDYLEFRWIVDGKRRLSARLGTPSRDGRIKRDKAGIEAVTWLIDDFLSHRAAPVGTPRELALRMARLAHMIRDLIIAAFEKEPERGSLHAQFVAFKGNLIPDLSAEQFADMYAQTIAYGLFAARCNQSTGAGFTRQNAAYLLPRTNPFLRKLFNHIAGPDLDGRIAWLVDDLAQLLEQADMEAVLKNFGKRSAKEDPVVHFYETF